MSRALAINKNAVAGEPLPPSWSQGPQGPPGPQGPIGSQGFPGNDGHEGIQGDMGPAGATGAPGPVGPAGATGPAGPTGPGGVQGPTGPIGPSGPSGSTGPAGADSTVPGPTGPQGVQGIQGNTGPQGIQGATGPGVTAGGTTGQVLTKINATDYNSNWQTPSTGLALPLAQTLTFSPDSTFDIGATAASRPRDLYLGRNGVVGGTLTLSADPTLALQAATKQYADTKITQAQGDARYPLTTAPDPYPQYQTQAEDDARYLQLTGGTLTGNLLFSTDNLRDIGASGATRPRDLFLGRNALVGGTLGVTGATTLAGLTVSGTLSLPTGSVTSTMIADGTVASADMAAGAAATNVGTLAGVLSGTLPSPGMAAGAAATNVGTLGGVLTGTLPSPGLATGSVTTTQIADGTIATADLANSAVTNAKLGTDTARANLLTNGGMEIWQRGNGPFTTPGVYCADRWFNNIAGATQNSVVRDTTNQDAASAACAACTITAYNTESFLSQKIEDATQLRGRTITWSCRVRTSTASAVRLGIYNGTALVYGAYHTGGGTYETLTVTTTISAGATLVQCNTTFNANCTAYIDNAMLVVGSVAADYAPMHPADDLARCLRYYEAIGGAAGMFGTAWVITTSNTVGPLSFKVPKAVTPTVTVQGGWSIQYGGGTIATIGSHSPSAATISGFTYQSNSVTGAPLTVGQGCGLLGVNAASMMIGEANP